MKKFIIIALLASTTGIIASCTKDNSVAPAKAKTNIFADKSELGQGDFNPRDTVSNGATTIH